MDSSKRQFLAQLGVLTAGASLVPLAEAKFPFSPSASNFRKSSFFPNASQPLRRPAAPPTRMLRRVMIMRCLPNCWLVGAKGGTSL